MMNDVNSSLQIYARTAPYSSSRQIIVSPVRMRTQFAHSSRRGVSFHRRRTSRVQGDAMERSAMKTTVLLAFWVLLSVHQSHNGKLTTYIVATRYAQPSMAIRSTVSMRKFSIRTMVLLRNEFCNCVKWTVLFLCVYIYICTTVTYYSNLDRYKTEF